jgi:hypothetical protein
LKNNLYISVIAIILIFIYWKNKRDRAFYDCANVWDSLQNSTAQGDFVDQSNDISNDQDAIISIESEYGSNNVQYGICITAFNQLEEDHLIRPSEKELVIQCICDKMKDTNDFNASSFVRSRTFI